MIALLQRVSHARVEIGGTRIASIGGGLLVLVAVERGDDVPQVDRMLERILTYRVFADAHDRMSLNLADTRGGLLLVPQFTLAADTRKGTRPSFAAAARPEVGETLFDALVETARQRHAPVAAGHFGTNMKVHLVNEGPVTFWLRTAPAHSA